MNPNDPANEALFSLSIEDGIVRTSCTLSKREYFAAMVMQGLMASELTGDEIRFARDSVRMADALIAELSKDSK